MTPKQLLLIWELNFSLLKFYLLNIDDPLLELARKCNGLMLGTDNSQEEDDNLVKLSESLCERDFVISAAELGNNLNIVEVINTGSYL